MNRSKRNKIVFAAILFCCACIIGFYLMHRNHHQSVQSTWQKENAQVCLWYNENASKEEKEEDLRILTQRLDSLFGKDYSLKSEGDKLILEFPISYKKNLNMDVFLEKYIIEPKVFTICAYEEYHTPTLCRIDLEDFEEVSIVHDENGLEIDGGEVSDYIKITFSDTVNEYLKPNVDSKIELALIDSYIYNDHKTNDLASDGYILYYDEQNPNSYYIILDEYNIDFADYIVYLLTTEKMNWPFEYKALSGETQWQEIENTTFSGINQCNSEDFKDDFYVINYKLSKRITNEEFETLEQFLKNRLDLLETKYAFGNIMNQKISIKVSPEKVNRPLLDTLTNSGNIIFLCDGEYETLSIEGGNSSFEYNEEDHYISFLIRDNENLMKMTQKKGKTLYFAMDNLIIASLPIQETINNNELVFRDFRFPAESSMDSQWFINYLTSLLNDRCDNLRASISLEDYYYMDYGTDYKNDSYFKLKEPNLPEIEQTEEKIMKICPQATFEYDQTTRSIDVDLHGKVDDTLFSDTIPMVEKIYKNIDFDKTLFHTITFTLYETEKDERAWLTFFTDSEGKRNFGGYLYNGRIDEYKDELFDFVEKDTFFRQYIDESGNGWLLPYKYK